MHTNVLTLNKIKTQTVQVNEPILKASLLDFFFTSTKQNKQEWETKFFYHYFESSKNYFIASFKHVSPTVALIPHVLIQHYTTNKSSQYDLFITSSFFALYTHEKLVYFKATSQNVTPQEIIHFLQQSLNITISQTYHINDALLQEYCTAYDKQYKSTPTTYNYCYFSSIKKTMHYMIFCLCVMGCLLGTVYFSLFHTTQKSAPVLQAPLKTKTLKVSSLLAFFESLNQHNLTLLTLNVQQSNAKVKLRHHNKNQLINFLETSNLKMRSLNYLKKEQQYELLATFILL